MEMIFSLTWEQVQEKQVTTSCISSLTFKIWSVGLVDNVSS